MKEKQEGITLIALVITIIVLLILAGVSIAMLTGQNGILSQAENAKEQTEDSKNWEQVKLAVTTGKLENITKGTDLNTAIQNELRKTDSAATVTGETDEKEITYFGKVYNVNVETGATSGGEDAFQKPDYNEAMLSLKQKDYVLYDTGKAEVGENGKILCQVLYEASSPYGLQIIPVDCMKENGEYVEIKIVENLHTGPYDVVFYNINQYNNSIKNLNDKAINYTNENFVIDARCVGSNPINKNSENKETYIDDEGYNTEIKEEDKNYVADYEELANLNMLNTTEPYWMASRYKEEGTVYLNEQGIRFKLRVVGAKYEWIIGYGGIYISTFDNSFGFRPIFLLKGDLQITAGNGQEATPYELGV